MSSLVTNLEDLKSRNSGMSKLSFLQVPCTRDCTTSQFSAGAQRFPFSIDSGSTWMPSKSYVRIRYSLTKADGTILTDSKVAPVMSTAANLYQSLEFRMGGKTVSRVSADVPQIDALKSRLTKSKAWLDSLGQDSNNLHPLQADRGAKARLHTSQELIWQPPLGIMDQMAVVGGTSLELVMNPQPSSVLSLGVVDATVDLATSDYKFQVESVFLIVAIAQTSTISDMTYYMDIDEIGLSTDDMAASTSYLSHQFEVSPSTSALTVAFQQQGTGADIEKPASIFRLAGSDPDNGIYGGDELSLSRFSLQYAGQSYPPIDEDGKWAAGGEAFITESFIGSQINTLQYFQEAGGESEADWRARGSFRHFLTVKNAGDRSTRVNVSRKFDVNSAVGNILLFSHYKNLLRVRVASGMVVETDLVME
jgi:hypothetical protein